MTSAELENLVRTGTLKREPRSDRECDALIQSGRARLHDATNASLSPESRFDLAYNAAHALALAALRWHGYRSESRYVVFQALAHTLGVSQSTWRVLAKVHALRNQFEYEGEGEVDERLIADLVEAARVVLVAVTKFIL